MTHQHRRPPGRRLAASAVAVVLVAATVLAVGFQPSPAGAAPKDPVVIVGGTFVNQPIGDFFYATMRDRLVADGYSATIFGLPDAGLGDINDAAAALADHVASVRASTGASRVDLVGHSQGGLVARSFVKSFGGAAQVDSLITLGTPSHGTAVANIVGVLGPVCFTACQQMTIGSSYLADLNAGDDSIGSVAYTNIATIYDELVVPYTSAFLNTGDGNITNVTVQGQCLFKIVEHAGLGIDATVHSGIVDALAHQPITLDCWAW